MNHEQQLVADLLASLKARPDVAVLAEPPDSRPDRPASWYELFAIESAVSLLGTFQEGKPPFEVELLKLLVDTHQQLLRMKINPVDTAPLHPQLTKILGGSLVAHFESEGYTFALYVSSIATVDESNPGATIARIGLALNVDSTLL